ncbi:MAG: hypothetical protein IJ243_00500 [Prevotella sp.]|nr:hypothetical protein [Prevotella sp.]
MTNEELTAAFPECERIKREQVAPIVEQVMNEVESWREISWGVKKSCKELWPEPEYRTDAYNEWGHYFYGDWKTGQKDFDTWVKLLEDEYLQRTGERRTLDEACQLAADEWTRMIFGNHVQNNGDQSDAGGMAMVLGTLAKDKASRGIGSEVVEKFRTLCKEFYIGGCRVDEGKYGWRVNEPYCDYHPNSPLADLLLKAGVPEKSVGNICPWKTGISVDDRDHAVIVRGYQTERYI